ncbi:MAG: orotidine-5'-phosphate decarboxylase [Deltaproteobacteria bacterium]|nr:orotidine-5'-phosphate decarboxylase [Deltaproteobacteria bacterium]
MNARLSAPGRERVIVALDVPDLAQLETFLDRLEAQPRWYKVGLELFLAEGARAIEAVKRRNGRVFLDLKLHDISETVARAVASVRRLGVELLTVHASGGHEMIKRAVEATEGQMKILGVTVLTSLQQSDLQADGLTGSVADVVARRARVLREAGGAGLVCSPQEVATVRGFDNDLLLVVPGIRPAGAALGDQKRVGTPAEAIAAGADYLVVGRPLRDAAQPAAAFAALAAEIDGALGATK